MNKKFYYEGHVYSSATELINFVREEFRRKGLDINVVEYLVNQNINIYK